MSPPTREPNFPWGYHGRIRKPRRWSTFPRLGQYLISTEELRQRARRLKCELIMEKTLRENGIAPLPRIGKKRGAQHPLPRRAAKDPSERLDYDAHKKLHQYEYRPGCPKCYAREHMYYQTYPDKRPSNIWTAGCGNDSLPEQMTRNWPKETDTDGY